MKPTTLITLLLLVPLAALAQTQPGNLTSPAEWWRPLVALLGGEQGWLAAVLGWMAALRVPAKFVQGWIQCVLSKAISRAIDTDEPEDDALLLKLFYSRPYRVLAFTVDVLLSIKLPTGQTLIDAAKAKNPTYTPPAYVLGLLLSGVLLLAGCASYKTAGVVTVTATRAMQSWGSYYDQAHAQPALFDTTITRLEDQRRNVDKAWEAYRFAMNSVDDTRRAGGDLNAALATANARSGELVNLILSFLPEKFKPTTP